MGIISLSALSRSLRHLVGMFVGLPQSLLHSLYPLIRSPNFSGARGDIRSAETADAKRRNRPLDPSSIAKIQPFLSGVLNHLEEQANISTFHEPHLKLFHQMFPGRNVPRAALHLHLHEGTFITMTCLFTSRVAIWQRGPLVGVGLGPDEVMCSFNFSLCSTGTKSNLPMRSSSDLVLQDPSGHTCAAWKDPKRCS